MDRVKHPPDEDEAKAEEAERDAIKWSGHIRAMSPNRVQLTDSLELIREGRGQ